MVQVCDCPVVTTQPPTQDCSQYQQAKNQKKCNKLCNGDGTYFNKYLGCPKVCFCEPPPLPCGPGYVQTDNAKKCKRLCNGQFYKRKDGCKKVCYCGES